ncbi:hypothetical protein ACLK2A_01740 [Escherichia coli]
MALFYQPGGGADKAKRQRLGVVMADMQQQRHNRFPREAALVEAVVQQIDMVTGIALVLPMSNRNAVLLNSQRAYGD